MGYFEQEEIYFEKGLFDSICDAVYILTMKNSTRRKQYMCQINEFKLHQNIFIMKNKGYKNYTKKVCNRKNECKIINDPPTDITNAYVNTLKHAKSMKYEKIIILEDDFICSPELKNEIHIKNIEAFTSHMNDSTIFSFGVLPFITTYHDQFIRRSWVSTGIHATLIPKSFFNKIIDEEYYIDDIDVYLQFISRRYIYYKPLITQRFPITENFQHWGNNCVGEFGGIIFRLIMRQIIVTFGLDQREEPGTSKIYWINQLTYDYVIPLVFIILIFICIMPIENTR